LTEVIELDPADIRNGWTPETLEAYRAQREAVHRLTAGNVVTEFHRPKPAKVLIGAKQFNPHKW
jgi:hypothetical protein